MEELSNDANACLLVDSRGRVAGVNTAIIAMAQGLGFAVPANTVQWVTSEFVGRGKVRRRQLGVAANSQRLPPAFVREFDLLNDRDETSNPIQRKHR